MKDEDHWKEEIKEDYGMNEWMNELMKEKE
jgi:hypothetical protein